MTLTEAAAFTKKAMYFVGIPLGVIVIVWLFIGLLRPPQDLPERYITPDYMCGKLPKFELDSLGQELSDTKFSIETTSGAIPDLPKVVNVFSYDHAGQSLLALQEAQNIAENLGFDPEAFTRKSTTEYIWKNQETVQTLEIETGNLNVSMTTDFTNPNVNTYSSTLPSESNAKIIAIQYLRNRNLLTTDYNDGYQKTYLIQITASGEFREAPSLSQADLVRVDFFREKELITVDPELVGTEEVGSTLQEELEKEKTTTVTGDDSKSKQVKEYTTDIVNDSPIFANISVYVGGSESENVNRYDVYKLEYKNWNIASSPCGTYQLISPEEAVRQVQEGEGILVHLLEDDEDRIIPPETKSVDSMNILEVSIVYLDRSIKQDYLQPVFLIHGEAEFSDGRFGPFDYYVPAIDYDSIPEDAGQTTTEPAEEEGG